MKDLTKEEMSMIQGGRSISEYFWEGVSYLYWCQYKGQEANGFQASVMAYK